MAEHLTAKGRAGIIVPEGIIFQSQTAYRQLRKMLVEEYLVAVVSLPAGVFNPYSGVKTSILILDRSLAKQTDSIGFFKVENDGFDLGAQRRQIDRDDLPQVQTELTEYLGRRRSGEQLDDLSPTRRLVVAKKKIAARGEYSLSGERYRDTNPNKSRFTMVPLGEIAELIRGITFRRSDQLGYSTEGSLLVATTKAAQESGIIYDALYNIPRSLLKDERKLLRQGDILISTANSLHLLGRTTHVRSINEAISFGAFMSVIRPNQRVLDTYLLHCLRTEFAHAFYLKNANTTTNISNLNLSVLAEFQIPLPPLEVQQEIVAEIEVYQKVIDGARAVVENYRPYIAIDPGWPMVGIVDLIADDPYSLKAGPFGSTLKKECYVPSGYKVYGQEQVIRGDATYGDYYISREKYDELENCRVKAGDVLVSLVGTYGMTLIVPSDHEPGIINPRLVKITLNQQKMIPEFLVNMFTQDLVFPAGSRSLSRWNNEYPRRQDPKGFAATSPTSRNPTGNRCRDRSGASHRRSQQGANPEVRGQD